MDANPNPLNELPRQFAQRAEAMLRIGLRIEADCFGQLSAEGDVSPGKYQAAMVNFCGAIENAAKSLITSECPPGIFSLAGNRKGKLTFDSIRDLWNPGLEAADLQRLLLNHHLLGFDETLREAKVVRPDLRYPVDPEILSAARNQAVHSLVLDEGRQVDLAAVTALYMLDFLQAGGGIQTQYLLEPDDKERLETFQRERMEAAQAAHKALQKVRSARFLYENIREYDRDRDSENCVHVRCPLCQVRARIVVDPNRTWLESGTIVLFTLGSTNLHFVYPKHFSCPGCKLELYDRAVCEAGLRFSPMPLPGILDAWQTDDTPLSEEDLAEMHEAN